MKIERIDMYGNLTYEPDTRGMLAPGRCKRCHQIHDSGSVEVVARYQDCTVWKCPNCGAHIDDRPIGWGGSFEPIQRRARPFREQEDANG